MEDLERKLYEVVLDVERRYGELRTRLAKMEVEIGRNYKLLWAVFAGMLAVLSERFWPILFG